MKATDHIQHQRRQTRHYALPALLLVHGLPLCRHAGVPLVSAATHLEREDERDRERDEREREREEPARECERERLRDTLRPAGDGDLPPASLPTTGACSDNYHSLPEPS